MIVRCVFTLERERNRLDKRRLRDRETEAYDDGSGTTVAGTFRSTDVESYRLAHPLLAVYQYFLNLGTKDAELGSMKFSKFCKVGCHNLFFDYSKAQADGVKEGKAFKSGKYGHVKSTSIDLAHSKALADMAGKWKKRIIFISRFVGEISKWLLQCDGLLK